MFAIRLFVPADTGALAALIVAMQAHYGVYCPPRSDIENSLRQLAEGVEILVAEAETIVGFAAFATIFPGPGLQAGFFLKELYVAKTARGSGVGKALMRALAALAVTRGLKRIDWTADAKDRPLNAFYQSLGAHAHTEKVFFRLTGDELAACAAREH